MLLKDKPPGTFVVRDSQSYEGAFGLAVKVATPPLGVIQQAGGDLSKYQVSEILCTSLFQLTFFSVRNIDIFKLGVIRHNV